MGYREASRDEAKTVHVGLVLPWRGVVAAVACALGAGLVLFVHGIAGVALWAPMLGLAIFTLATTARRAHRITMRVLPRARVVIVSERSLAGSTERELEVPAEAVLRVDVTRDESWLAQLPGPALTRATVALVAGSRETVLVSALLGAARARAIAAALREVLALPPVRTNDELGPRGWAPSRTTTTFVIALTLVILAGTAVEAVNATRTGVLQLECVEHCRFDGIDCLPGGSLEGRYDPGELVVEVVDPRAPGGMRAVRIPIARRHRTRFECREGAVSPTPVPED